MPLTTTIKALALLALPLLALAQKWECASNGYPYCVHVMSDEPSDGGKWPTMIFLPGSGARGSASNAASLAGYDGHGKMIYQYYNGQKGKAQTTAAEKFLTIVPIAPDGSRHFDPDKVLDILNEVKGKYNVDESKVYVSGFSMGCRGCWRFGVYHPEVLAAAACSAGPAEDNGMDTLKQEYATATYPMLDQLVNVPLRNYAGRQDTTAGYTEQQKDISQLQKLGSDDAELIIMEGKDHSAMSTAPWTDTDMLDWFLSNSRSGGSSDDEEPTDDDEPTSSSVSSATGRSKPTQTSAPVPESTSEPDSDEEEEDCEEEEEEVEPASTDDEEEEDCEDEEESEPEMSADGEEEEDCEEEEEATKRDVIPETPVVYERQLHHFVFDHSKRDLPIVHPVPANETTLQRRSPLYPTVRHRRGWHQHRMISMRRKTD